ncbi:MAG: cytochrome c [Flavobacteriales bacterium]|nr:cytochrome c [Flavobacteriales bacterium]
MKKLKFVALFLVAGILASCGGETPKEVKTKVAEAPVEETVVEEEVVVEEPVEESKGDIGVGPITSVTLGEIDDALVEKGKELYKINCTACHKMGKRVVGPALAGVTERRTPEWIMNMIMNPEEMVEKDPTAKALLAEYLAPMANQNITEDEARAILEFFRTKN